MQRLDDSNETNVEVEDTEEDPDDVACFSPSVNDASTECISTTWEGGGEHVDVTDSSFIKILKWDQNQFENYQIMNMLFIQYKVN